MKKNQKLKKCIICTLNHLIYYFFNLQVTTVQLNGWVLLNTLSVKNDSIKEKQSYSTEKHNGRTIKERKKEHEVPPNLKSILLIAFRKLMIISSRRSQSSNELNLVLNLAVQNFL